LKARLAAIFAGATGTELRLHIGLRDLSDADAGRRLAQALQADPSLRARQGLTAVSEQSLGRIV